MNQYDDWILIRQKSQAAKNLLPVSLLVEWGDFVPGSPNSIILVGSATTLTKQKLTIIAKAIRTVLYGYPTTVPVATVRLTWPIPGGDPIPGPDPQDPGAPPVLIPPLPPTTPPTANDRIFVV